MLKGKTIRIYSAYRVLKGISKTIQDDRAAFSEYSIQSLERAITQAKEFAPYEQFKIDYKDVRAIYWHVDGIVDAFLSSQDDTERAELLNILESLGMTYRIQGNV